jgi:hypothetical protein
MMLGVENMTNLIKVTFDETEIWVESEGEAEAEVPERVSVIGKATKKVIPFKNVSDTVRAFCTSLVESFEGLKPAPNRISAEFGLKLSAEGTVYVVKSTAECSLKITVDWQIKHER